jgi:hypothetical protein
MYTQLTEQEVTEQVQHTGKTLLQLCIDKRVLKPLSESGILGIGGNFLFPVDAIMNMSDSSYE